MNGALFLLGCLREAELSGSLQKSYHHHISQVFLHWYMSFNVPVGGRLTDFRGITVTFCRKDRKRGPQQSWQG